MKIKEKPITNEVRQLVHHIVDKWLDYNNTPTEQEFTGDKPTFFVELSGHIGNIFVDCHTGGYVANGDFEHCGKESVHLSENEYEAEEDILANLNRVLADMDRYYNDWLSRQEAAPNE